MYINFKSLILPNISRDHADNSLDWNIKGLPLRLLSFLPITLSRLISCHYCDSGRSERKLNKTGKMTHVVSRTMSLIGVAFLIHFIIMSTLAENGKCPLFLHHPSTTLTTHLFGRESLSSTNPNNKRHLSSPDSLIY